MTETGSRRWSGLIARRLALLGFGLLSSALPAAATDIVTARPHEFVFGPARGYAVTAAVDTARSHQAPLLPAPDAARVAWQRQIAGGIGTNLLVDAEGRIFAVGPGRVTQLDADGATQFSQIGDFSSALSAALLADGSRAILTREGRVLAWSAHGGATFDVALEAPAAQVSSSLLPLPDGGALASLGQWVFEIDATRAVRSYASLPASIQHTLLIGGNALLVDEQGRVFEWDRRELPRQRGAFSGATAAALWDGRALLGLTSRRSVERLDLADAGRRELARLDPPGAAPLLLASIEPGHWVLMQADGSWLGLPADAPALAPSQRGGRDAPGHLQLLADSTGAVAWWADDEPLHLETASGFGSRLGEVHCATPASLVPAGRSRIVAACGSGAIWLVGPGAPPEP